MTSGIRDSDYYEFDPPVDPSNPQTPITHFGLWEKEDIAGGKVYHRVEIEHYKLTIDLPYILIHHGEFGAAERLKLQDVLGELSKLLRFWVIFGDVDQGLDGQDLEDGHELAISLGTSVKRAPDGEVRLLSVIGDYKGAGKMLGFGEIGAREMVNREMMMEIEAREVVESTKRFEGPVWLIQAEGGDGE